MCVKYIYGSDTGGYSANPHPPRILNGAGITRKKNGAGQVPVGRIFIAIPRFVLRAPHFCGAQNLKKNDAGINNYIGSVVGNLFCSNSS